MNDLLPKLSELKPITKNEETFFDCGFNAPFDNLDLIQKLKVINDIIRQTILYHKNYDENMDLLMGNNFTAAKAFNEYVKQNLKGVSCVLAIAWNKSYETSLNATIDFVNIVSDGFKKIVINSNPIISYNSGVVEELNYNSYKEYIPISKEIFLIISRIREINYLAINNLLNENSIEEIKKFLLSLDKHYFLRSLIRETLMNLEQKNISSKEDCDIILISKQIEKWKEELNSLIKEGQNFKKTLELYQSINVLEDIIYQRKKLKPVYYNNEENDIKNLNPRFFYESGLSLITIKPSAYLFGWEEKIANFFLEDKYEKIGEYDFHVSLPSKEEISLMKFFHPHGYKYEREMSGPIKVFLINRKAEENLSIKRTLRKSLKEGLAWKDIMWFDGTTIKWNPMCLNFVHSSDNCCETSLGYFFAYPEYQVMNRFMYPNPTLIKKEKENERIRA